MSLLVFSVPLLPVVAVMTALFRSPLSALCRQVYSGILKLSHRKVCVSSTHAYVFSNCTHGQAQSVLLTFDLYSTTHASSNIGPQKGAFLDEIVTREAPLRVLELGTHCGYASVRILRLLPPSGKLLTVELDPLTADRGEEIILVAGFKNQQVLTCSSAEAISSLPSHTGNDGLDLVLMDHDPELYLQDLLALQRGNLLSTSCVVLINRALTPGAPDLLEYVTARPQSFSVGRQLHGLMEIRCHTGMSPQTHN
ncbi:transmembrane O-methyltransferase homolog isoform X3 [Ctenopharyngodon idella]|uniref:transmembrane O-methyltransferase homolog isoform X4 n=1 Tax=Ctenopharyngodon idella TaxID=7959 RepID=UPI00222EBEDC|nr:transmembrane O-methyltransferase homolog isoform X4 [Ctenopharyngodon idella]XP_051715507.1 transmembrane O-methyltransferase homolog isoform X3 [Ctenopharyngodon idella]XP_051716255.1 transmembrane O-methyltransferase homolog isoform X3 [Ctenopharyngodon idella]